MAYGQNPLLNPHQVRALLGQWYDIQGPAVGNWGHHGPYGGALAYGSARPGFGYPGAYLGQALPAAPPAPPMPMAPQPAPMAPQMMAPDAMQMQMPMQMQMQMPFPPRAALVEMPPPTRANRDILPMSTGVPILPTQSAQITGRPQVACFVPGRVVCSNAGTAGGAADWIFNDVKVGNVSQFVQSGDVPGDLFAVNAIDTFVRFAPVQTAMDFVFVVTYIGLNESGCPFFGAVLGAAAI